MNAKIDNYLARVYFSISRCLEICTIVMFRAKKYIEPPIQIRRICLLQWKEIKTKNSRERHYICGGQRE